jgi:2-methylcitrate dehydratase
MQYIVATGLIHGTLTADHYEDAAAADPRVDELRAKTVITEEPRYSRDYLDPDKRSIASAVRVRFADGTATEPVEVEYPLGHRMRRDEGLPLLAEKFRANVATRFPRRRAEAIAERCADHAAFARTTVPEFLELLAG